MKDAETGQRGFLLTGNEAFLDQYVAVRDSFAVRLGTLRRLSVESATHEDLAALAPLLDAKLAGMAHLIGCAVTGTWPARRRSSALAKASDRWTRYVRS